MPTEGPHGVVTLRGDGGIEQLLRRAVARIDALGLDVLAVIDHSGDAGEAGLTLPDTKLVLFGSPTAGLILAHPEMALDLPLKLLIYDRGHGEVVVGYNAPAYLAHRYRLTDEETDALRVVETIARATASPR